MKRSERRGLYAYYHLCEGQRGGAAAGGVPQPEQAVRRDAESAGLRLEGLARAGNRRIGLLSARRAHTNAPYKNRFTMENATGA